jgi:hypothetical protein
MQVKDLYEGMIFRITNDDNAETTVTEGKITNLYKIRDGETWGIQFDDELGTFTWGKDDDDIAPRGFEYLGDFNPNQDRR